MQFIPSFPVGLYAGSLAGIKMGRHSGLGEGEIVFPVNVSEQQLMEEPSAIWSRRKISKLSDALKLYALIYILLENPGVWVKSWSRNCPHCIVIKVTSGSDILSLTVTVVEISRGLGNGLLESWLLRMDPMAGFYRNNFRRFYMILIVYILLIFKILPSE